MSRNSEIWMQMLHDALDVGEIPYRANRNAVHAFDIDEDAELGLKELNVLENGIGIFIAELEKLENVAHVINEQAAKSFL